MAASIQLMSHRSTEIQTTQIKHLYIYLQLFRTFSYSFHNDVFYSVHSYKELNNVHLRRLTPQSKFITEYLELDVWGGFGSGSEGVFSVAGAILYTGSDEGGDEKLCTCSTSGVFMLFPSCDTLRSCRCLTKVRVCCERDVNSLETFSNCQQAQINRAHEM